MGRRVVWTEAAWNDLETAADYIAKDSPRYAAAFVREICEAARSLVQFSERAGSCRSLDKRNLESCWSAAIAWSIR